LCIHIDGFDEERWRADEMMKLGRKLYVYGCAPQCMDIEIPGTSRTFHVGMSEKVWCEAEVVQTNVFNYPFDYPPAVRIECSPNKSLPSFFNVTLSVPAFRDMVKKGLIKEKEYSILKVEEWDEPITNNVVLHHIAQVLYDI